MIFSPMQILSSVWFNMNRNVVYRRVTRDCVLPLLSGRFNGFFESLEKRLFLLV